MSLALLKLDTLLIRLSLDYRGPPCIGLFYMERAPYGWNRGTAAARGYHRLPCVDCSERSCVSATLRNFFPQVTSAGHHNITATPESDSRRFQDMYPQVRPCDCQSMKTRSWVELTVAKAITSNASMMTRRVCSRYQNEYRAGRR